LKLGGIDVYAGAYGKITMYKRKAKDAKALYDTARTNFAAAEKALAQNKNTALSNGLVDAVDAARKAFDLKEVEFGLAKFILDDAQGTAKALAESRKEIDREAAREVKQARDEKKKKDEDKYLADKAKFDGI
jgi:hypothetical protein